MSKVKQELDKLFFFNIKSLKVKKKRKCRIQKYQKVGLTQSCKTHTIY